MKLIKNARIEIEQIEAYFPITDYSADEVSYKIGIKFKSGNNLMLICDTQPEQNQCLTYLDKKCID